MAVGAAALALVGALLLAACGSVPRPGSVQRDGPAAEIPPDLARVPDAEPKVEPIRAGGPNKPYEVQGRTYTPETRDVPIREKGLASWYGRKFHGRKTASGELYDMHAMTAAHKTMPLPSYARVRNPANGREVVVRINDRGPFVAGRVIDLSYTAALKLDLLRGVAPVEVERLTAEDIRTGAWRRPVVPGDTAVAAAAAATAPAAVVAPVPTPAQMPVASPVAASTPGAAQPPARATTPPPAEPRASEGGSADAPPAVAVAAAETSPSPPASPSVADAPPARAGTAAARGFWVQLGAFREREGAVGFRRRVAGELDWIAPLLAVFSDAPLYRLQAGPYATRDDAQGVAARVREALQLVPVIVERR